MAGEYTGRATRRHVACLLRSRRRRRTRARRRARGTQPDRREEMELMAKEKEEMQRRGERGLATRQFQDPFSLVDAMFERMHRDLFPGPLLGLLGRGRGESETEGGMRVPRVQIREQEDALEI